MIPRFKKAERTTATLPFICTSFHHIYIYLSDHSSPSCPHRPSWLPPAHSRSPQEPPRSRAASRRSSSHLLLHSSVGACPGMACLCCSLGRHLMKDPLRYRRGSSLLICYGTSARVALKTSGFQRLLIALVPSTYVFDGKSCLLLLRLACLFTVHYQPSFERFNVLSSCNHLFILHSVTNSHSH